MAVTLRYFTKFGKPALQKAICGGIYARVYCIFSTQSLFTELAFRSVYEYVTAAGWSQR